MITEKKIRVCHISSVHSPSDVRIFYRECCSLVEAGYEVHLVIPSVKNQIKNGIHLYSIPSFGNRFLRMLFAPCCAIIRAVKLKCDIYHYHDPELIWMGFILRWIFRKRVVYDIHESVHNQILSKHYLPSWIRKPLAKTYRILEKIFLPGQMLVIANQNSIKDYPESTYLVQNYPIVNQNIERVIETSTKQDPPLLIYVGGISEIRGSGIYLELARCLAQKKRDFQMKIVGPHSLVYLEKMKTFLKDNGLENYVEIHGRTEWFQAMKWVAEAQIGLCLLLPVPNYTSCLATKIIEYMMVGTACLASNFDCWKPYVEGEKTGMMANPEDIEQVVSVCESMLDNPAELKAMGVRGLEAVRSRYNWNSEFENLTRCYKKVMGFSFEE